MMTLETAGEGERPGRALPALHPARNYTVSAGRLPYGRDGGAGWWTIAAVTPRPVVRGRWNFGVSRGGRPHLLTALGTSSSPNTALAERAAEMIVRYLVHAGLFSTADEPIPRPTRRAPDRSARVSLRRRRAAWLLLASGSWRRPRRERERRAAGPPALTTEQQRRLLEGEIVLLDARPRARAPAPAVATAVALVCARGAGGASSPTIRAIRATTPGWSPRRCWRRAGARVGATGPRRILHLPFHMRKVAILGAGGSSGASRRTGRMACCGRTPATGWSRRARRKPLHLRDRGAQLRARLPHRRQ